MGLILGGATILGGIAAVWYFWEKIAARWRGHPPHEAPRLADDSASRYIRTPATDALASLILEKLRSASPVASPATPDHDVLFALIAKVQSKKQPLAESFAEALRLARSAGDADLAAFCTEELVGYARVSDAQAAARVHRHMPAYCTTGQIDIMGMGLTGLTLAAVVDRHRDQFSEKVFVLGEPIATLEDKAAAKRDDRGFWHAIRKLRDFNPKAKPPDAEVHCYSEPHAYARVVAATRAELTRRLTALLTRSDAKGA